MVWGTIILGAGGILTLVTYNAAQSGGAYFIFWGAMLVGGMSLLRGLWGWFANQD